MNSLTRTFVCLILLTASLTSPGLPARAQDPTPSSSSAAKPNHRTGWLKDLNLSADQSQKIEAIRKQNEPSLKEKNRQLQQNRQKLTQMLSGSASAADIRQQRQQVQSLSQEVENKRFETLLSIREVLNPEQRRQMNEKMRERANAPRDRLPRSPATP